MQWRLGVAGYPVEHSLSPQLHVRGLELARMQGSSARLAMRDAREENLRGLMGERFDALSVTMPLKDQAAGLCDGLDATATRIGVVNSLLYRDGRVLGSSTDGRGFVNALDGSFGVGAQGMTVAVLGAGGAARGIVDALVEAGAASVTVVGRTRANVDRLIAMYAPVVAPSYGAGPFDLLVNTLPSGARVDQVVPDGVDARTLCVDITYEPRVSEWSHTLESMGCRVTNGLAMLAHQAALQMQWWWDVEIDVERLVEVLL